MAQQQSRPGSGRKPSPEVYRRRRIVAGVALLVVLALLVWAVVAVAGLFGGGNNGETGAAQPSATPSGAGQSPASGSGGASPSTPASADGADATGAPCADGDVSVKARTDQGSYGPEENPVLEMDISNQGSEDCSINVGTSQQEFNVVSGSDRIFSTTDCLKDPTDTNITLKAGATEKARFTWERLRSAPGCKADSTKPRPGTYTYSAKLGDLKSAKATFTLE